MRLKTVILIVYVLVPFLGMGQSKDDPSWYTNNWRGFSFAEAREIINNYSNIALVCISGDYWEHEESVIGGRTIDAGYLHHYKGTVTKQYKGSCIVSNQLEFAEGYCACGGKRPITTNTCVGNLIILLLGTNVQSNVKFYIDCTEREKYTHDIDQLIETVIKDSQPTNAPYSSPRETQGSKR